MIIEGGKKKVEKKKPQDSNGMSKTPIICQLITSHNKTPKPAHAEKKPCSINGIFRKKDSKHHPRGKTRGMQVRIQSRRGRENKRRKRW
jgi:hypothetical protein